jgi:dipeptidyl-peptidase-4
LLNFLPIIKSSYVSERNIYSEDLATGVIKKLTSDNGTKKLINGTFDLGI